MEKYETAIEQAYTRSVASLYEVMMNTLVGTEPSSLEEKQAIDSYRKGLLIAERAYQAAIAARSSKYPHLIHCSKCGGWHESELMQYCKES